MVRLACVITLGTGLLISPVAGAAEGFNPLKVARDAANLGLDTARKAVDLGINTAEDAADAVEDAFDADNCPKGERYKGRDGRWHTCR